MADNFPPRSDAPHLASEAADLFCLKFLSQQFLKEVQQNVLESIKVEPSKGIFYPV